LMMVFGGDVMIGRSVLKMCLGVGRLEWIVEMFEKRYVQVAKSCRWVWRREYVVEVEAYMLPENSVYLHSIVVCLAL
jgi:hypothetical protein